VPKLLAALADADDSYFDSISDRSMRHRRRRTAFSVTACMASWPRVRCSRLLALTTRAARGIALHSYPI